MIFAKKDFTKLLNKLRTYLNINSSVKNIKQYQQKYRNVFPSKNKLEAF
jgi:hypothetical protein